MQSNSIGLSFSFIISLLVFTTFVARGQCVIPARSYATTQQTFAGGLFASVSDAGNAADGNFIDFATLNGGLAGTATQYLDFGTTVPKGTPVTVKFSVPASLLSLLGGVTVQPYTNLRNTGRWRATAAGQATTDVSLLGLLNGAGDMEITIIPQETDGTTVEYTGVWISLSGISIAQSLKVYGAFITKDATSPVNCSSPVDILSGVRTTVIGGIANASGTVTNPWNAIDNDPTYSTYAELQVGVQVLSQVYHTTIFNDPSQKGDKVRMVLQKPGGGLLDLSLLSNFSIQLYNGSTPVGTAITSSSGLLSLSLLPGTAGDEKYQLDITQLATDDVFDRVDVQIGGVATVGLIQGLRIYDVKRVIATPNININTLPIASVTVCSGNTTALTVSNIQTCTTYKWYDAGGNLVATSPSYTPPAGNLSLSNPNKYYVEASRNGCTEVSSRSLATITVNPLPTQPVIVLSN